ncbi:hypothetical protein AAFN86_11595 [Roseomonas sp. CAU 1739]|uniref:hypothetical protein n=1 Tax=Roseomonas sp. CAU 1739 TaxID=3140364 RepID=UPI00325C051E
MQPIYQPITVDFAPLTAEQQAAFCRARLLQLVEVKPAELSANEQRQLLQERSGLSMRLHLLGA